MEIFRDVCGDRGELIHARRDIDCLREGLIPYFRCGVHERTRIRTHTYTHTTAWTDSSRCGRCVFARYGAVFYYPGKQNAVKKISNERIFRRSEDVTRNHERSALEEEFRKLEA